MSRKERNNLPPTTGKKREWALPPWKPSVKGLVSCVSSFRDEIEITTIILHPLRAAAPLRSARARWHNLRNWLTFGGRQSQSRRTPSEAPPPPRSGTGSGWDKFPIIIPAILDPDAEAPERSGKTMFYSHRPRWFPFRSLTRTTRKPCHVQWCATPLSGAWRTSSTSFRAAIKDNFHHRAATGAWKVESGPTPRIQFPFSCFSLSLCCPLGFPPGFAGNGFPVVFFFPGARRGSKKARLCPKNYATVYSTS